MNFNKENWKEVSFGDVADHIESTEKNEEARKSSNYVAVEHLDTLDLRVKGKAKEEQPTFSRKFKKGQILFAKRNLYLRKIAIAPFDGLCSPHLWALETNGSLSNELLAFIMQTNTFNEYVNSNAAGTMSKYLKWPALSQFRFKLPSKEEQEKILSLFLTLENQINLTEKQEINLVGTKRNILSNLFDNNKHFGDFLSTRDYETVIFGEISKSISKRIDPSKTNVETYVGLEHLDPDDLKINRQGVPSDVKGVKLLVNIGDIIFGKRRAYQRKVAVSHFDGICSAHSMVLRANTDKVKKDFLPYFMQSDIFMNRAIQISEGSLSPTIKWKVLEKQEFHIPKIEFQDKLVRLFKDMDDLIYSLREQHSFLRDFKHIILNKILG